MMNTRAAIAVLATAAATAFAGTSTAQDEQDMTMQDVPPAAMAAGTAAAAGIEFESVGLDLDGGTATYELAGKDADGMSVEVDVLADGSVVEVERQIDMGAVPDIVSSLLESYLEGFEPSMVEESTHANFEVWYEFEGELDGKSIDAEVSASGERILIQDDQAG